MCKGEKGDKWRGASEQVKDLIKHEKEWALHADYDRTLHYEKDSTQCKEPHSPICATPPSPHSPSAID